MGHTFSVSDSSLGRVKDYVEGQEKHHARRSFHEELMAFLEKREIAYDPRNVGP